MNVHFEGKIYTAFTDQVFTLLIMHLNSLSDLFVVDGSWLILILKKIIILSFHKG